MPRFQFSFRTLLILMFGCACFFAGMALQKRLDRAVHVRKAPEDKSVGGFYNEMVEIDGRRYARLTDADEP
ncbi:MAG: hypothetical protein ACREHD_17910 [Pirellulales bacterium]